MKRYSTLVINETQIKSHNAISLPIRMAEIEKIKQMIPSAGYDVEQLELTHCSGDVK